MDFLALRCVSRVLKSVVPPDISNMIVSSEFRGTGGLAGYTTNINIPSSNLLTVNYYDDYQFIDMMSAQEKAKMVFASTSGYDAQYADGAKGLLTGIRTYQLNEPNKYTVLANYYDYRGRIVQTHATNHLGGFEDEYMAYNFTGTVKHRKHVHAAAGQPIQTEIYSYTYDHAERLLTVSHKLNDFQEKPLLVNSYDESGWLRTQKKASETLSYTYNVRNWMTAITGNLFNETLTYNVDVDGLIPQTPTFNGNISAMKWKLSGVDNIYRGYQFSYDQNNRLTKALYGEGNNIFINNKYNELLTYDAAGNILTLQRNGKHDSGFGLIDNLTYTYNGNQLSKVTDAATAATTHYGAFQFVDGANVKTEYVYDANGNLTQDYNKKISKIEYNSLNLPSKLQLSEGHMAEYRYDAAGKKLSVTYTTSKTNLMVPMGSIVPPQATNVAMTLKTVYCGNMIYENGNLKTILIEGGYITFNGTAPVYHYYLQDHLGDNRVVVNANGTVEQVNHYYPFGGLFGENIGDDKQPYKYNGKELDRMHGLDWYDYGARHYDAALGRWMCMDPLTEKYYDVSPYVYCHNNSVNRMDPDGKADIKKDDSQPYKVTIRNGIIYNEKGHVIGEKPLQLTFPEFDVLVGGRLFYKSVIRAIKRVVINKIEIYKYKVKGESRQYGDHAIEQSQKRGFSRENVERIIDKGKRIEKRSKYGESQYLYNLGENSVVTNTEGTVITVFSDAPATQLHPQGYFKPIK